MPAIAVRSLILLAGVLALLAPGDPPARAAQPALPSSNSGLAGRNCGGTLLVSPDWRPTSQVSTSPGGGWQAGGAVDAVAGALRQITPAMTLDQNGRQVFAWQEKNTRDEGDIYFAGAVAGSGRRGVRVDDTGASAVAQGRPALAVDSAGALHAVWQDRRTLRVVQDRLYYAASSDSGLSWSNNALVATPSASQPNQLEPALLADQAGGLHLIWNAVGASRSDILYSQRNGAAWSAPVRINADLAAQRVRPTLALAADGDLLAAWQDRRANSDAVFLARLDLSGGASVWGREVQASPRGVAAGRPSIAVAADGTIYLAYQGGGNTGIFLVASGNDGASWGAPRLIAAGGVTNPRLAIDSNGAIHCIWCRLTGLADIMAGRSTDGGQSWGTPVVLASTSGTAEPLALVADDAGGVYAAWSNGDENAEVLFSARWRLERLYLPLLNR